MEESSSRNNPFAASINRVRVGGFVEGDSRISRMRIRMAERFPWLWHICLGFSSFFK
jgi:hypothetical protein